MLEKPASAQPLPQSWRNKPTPSTPLAPSVSSVLSDGPVFEQLAGMLLLKPGAPITWMGTLLARSPDMAMSADCIGPHVKPSTNWLHSTTGLPLLFCWGRFSVSTDDRMRRPLEPVSTSTPSMDW